jgi:hypothetical protein
MKDHRLINKPVAQAFPDLPVGGERVQRPPSNR